MFDFIKSIFNSSSPMFDDGPSVNVDGTPMMGSIDIHGHPFGVTDFDSGIHSCTNDMFDDSFSSCGHSSFDD